MIDTAVIFCGGKGTRISEVSVDLPKPMLPVMGAPILDIIISHYKKYGVHNFLLLGGHKVNVVADYFTLKGDPSIRVFDTGEDTQTGGRLLRVKHSLPRNFFLTYGDGISDVPVRGTEHLLDLNNLSAVLTAVHPVPRFGALTIRDSLVTDFSEKKDHLGGWINGGWMAVHKGIISYIENDNTNLEVDVLPQLAKNELLGAYTYTGYWHCIDTARDLQKANDDVINGVYNE